MLLRELKTQVTEAEEGPLELWRKTQEYTRPGEQEGEGMGMVQSESTWEEGGENYRHAQGRESTGAGSFILSAFT